MKRATWWIAVLAAVALIAAACSSDDSSDGGDSGGSGAIAISGSSTVEPISAVNAQAFSEDTGAGISVAGPGTGDGFKAFCAGDTDISDASRPIKDSEKESCAEAGIDIVELNVAIDGLSVLTSNNNSAVACLTFNDLYALLGPESTGFGTWDAANDLAAEIGGTTQPYPAADLSVTAPGEESGTYDTFVELVLEDLAEERGQEAATRPDYTASPNDNVIIEGIAGSDTSLGWVGYAFFLENQDRVQALQVDDGTSGCAEPTPDSIASGAYPLSRPLFIYVNPAKAEANPSLADFVDFYLSDEGLAAVEQTGYVPLADYTDVRARWEARETGSVANP